jgi:hypothetical protein
VFDQHGAPVAAEVRIWKSSKEFSFDGKNQFLWTDGTFDFGPLWPGDYILGAFIRKVPHTKYPAHIFLGDFNVSPPLTQATLRFYPGTSDFKLAKPIEVGLGQHISGITLTIPFDPDKWRRGTLVRQ